MAVIRKIWGPPGTGKTTELLRLVQEEVSRGTPLHRIAFLSFTRAAREVVQERLGASEQDVRWFRTIHGACTKVMGFGGAIINWADYRDFHKLTGMKITPSDFDEEFGVGDFNVALRAHQLSETTLRSPRDIIRDLPQHPNLQQTRYDAFVTGWTKYKRDNRKVDFMDMLTQYDGTPLPVDVMFLDEAQDLSALQWRVFTQMSAGASRVYMAGDDDQAIYTFIGGSEYGFLEHPCDEETVLKQSYRVPASVGHMADSVIRKVEHRKEKGVHWREEQGVISRMNREPMFMPWNEWGKSDVLVLCRHRKGASKVSDDLRAVGVPHSLNGETMNTWPEAKILHSFYALRDGKSITPRAASLLVEALGKNSNAFRGLGRRDRVSEIPGVDLKQLDWLAQFSTNKLVRARYLALNRLVQEAGYESLASDPKIRISTMHGSKGSEADIVVILPDCTGVVKRNIGTPTEIRLSYVALTRAKREVVLCVPRTDTYINHFVGG